MAMTSVSLMGARPALPVRSVRPARSSVKVTAVAKPQDESKARNAALAATVLSLAAAAPARADEVDSAVAAATSAIQAGGEVLRKAITAGGIAVDVAKDTYVQAKPSIDEAVKTATPIVKSTVDVLTKSAEPVVKEFTPKVSDAVKSSGVDIDTVKSTAATGAKAASTAVETATPYVSKAASALQTADPATLGEYALIGAAVFVLGPPILGVLGGLLTGYAGDVTPATALDMLESSSSCVVLDLRAPADKERSGVIDVPSGVSGRVLELEYAATANRSLRSQLRNPEKVEIAVTSMQIAALKKINKGTTIIMMDNNGSLAKTIAKSVAAQGFGKVYVMQGGFKGWSSAKLQVKPSSSVFSPTVVKGGIAGTIAGTFGNKGKSAKSLPPGRK